MKSSFLFAAIVLCANAGSLQAQTNAPINTVPEGITTFQLPATAQGVTTSSYFSAPLINDPIYTGAVSTITSSGTSGGADTVNIADSPAPWTAGQFATAAAPYFVKFLSGNETGRVLQVYANTTNSLTLDVTDGTGTQGTTSGQFVYLVNNPATTFDVAPGDTFEVFAGDTLGLMFGLNTSQSPLVLLPGNAIHADSVSLFDPKSNQLIQYYFSSTSNCWLPTGGSTNSNNIVIRPYTAFVINRHGGTSASGETASSFVLTGRVAEVNHMIKTVGSNKIVFDSSGYPVDVTLSSLDLGSNWVKGSALNADTISIYSTQYSKYFVYYQNSSGTWLLQGDSTGSNQGSVTIPAATTVVFTKHNPLSGGNSFLQPVIPYSLTN